jgi:glutamyl-tRNA reductase
MSTLAVGLSHRTAPVALLERAVLGADDAAKLCHELVDSAYVDEAMVLSTCNRVECYVEVGKFHGGVQDVSTLLARASGVPLDDLAPHLYVHYEGRAVQHVFGVACGLDSMVVGEAQVLGQLRGAYRAAREQGTLGGGLGGLAEQALRVGKRAHAETGIDRAGQSLVSVGVDLAAEAVGGLAGRRALVVGAGSMAALAASTLQRAGVGNGDVTVANRTPERARRLVIGGGQAIGLDDLGPALATADVVVCTTGSTGILIDAETVARAINGRADRPCFILDLALPRDVDPGVRRIPGVTVADLESLQASLDGGQTARDVDEVRALVAAEAADYLAGRRAAVVAPTVVALRSKAAEFVDAELLRLNGRLPGLDGRQRDEVAAAVRRVVDKLLHAPTVRVKELAEGPGGDAYAEALRELFELDPAAPQAVERADLVPEEQP